MRKVKSLLRNKITGRDPVAQLYRAVLRYVEAHGGALMVVGGVEVQVWEPGDEARGKFKLAVKCLGKPPKLGGKQGGV